MKKQYSQLKDEWPWKARQRAWTWDNYILLPCIPHFSLRFRPKPKTSKLITAEFRRLCLYFIFCSVIREYFCKHFKFLFEGRCQMWIHKNLHLLSQHTTGTEQQQEQI